MKKIPLRTCIVTKEKLEKRDLLRIVRTPDKEILVDETGKKNGKGAYIKKDITIVEKLKKSKALDRALDIEVPDEFYENLKNILQ